jgi:quercetin dioxygenase-like cupin family protein
MNPTTLKSNGAHGTNPQRSEIVRAGRGNVYGLGGPIVESLGPFGGDDAYRVMRGTLLPGTQVSLHSHPDPESFFVVSGEAEILIETATGLEWRPIRRGDFAHIPPGAKHAWRNPHAVPSEAVVAMTPRLSRFLCELGELYKNEGFVPEKFRELERQYGYWSGSPEENAAVGIAMKLPDVS